MKKERLPVQQSEKEKSKNYGRFLYVLFLSLTLCAVFSLPAFAASGPTVWDKAQEIMKDVYKQILLISTISSSTG